MNKLESILSSRTRAEIFTILFGMNQVELHNREIARKTGLSKASVRQELGKLTNLEIAIVRRTGNSCSAYENRGS